MKLGLRTTTGTAALSVLFSIGVARAEPIPSEPDQGRQPSDARASERGLRGFELMLRPAWGSGGSKSPVVYERAPLAYHPDPGTVYDGSASPYGGGFAGQLSAGYRFLPVLSIG